MAAVNTVEQKILAEWNAKFEDCRKARIPYEKQWRTNLAMNFGRHYARWVNNPTRSLGAALTDMPQEPWRVRDVTNFCKVLVRTEVAKLNKEDPQFDVIPPTNSDDDIAASRAARALAEHFIYSNNLNKKRRQGTWWGSITGVGFIKSYYNENKKDITGIGTVVYESPSPFHIYVPNLEVEDIQSQPYVIHDRALDIDTIHDLYGYNVEADTEASNDHSQSQFLSAIGVKEKKGKLKQVTVREFWIKPCKQFPQGTMFVATKNKILYISEPMPELDEQGNEVPVEPQALTFRDPLGPKPETVYPYDHGEFPFVKLDHIPAGRFYSQSTLDDLISLQKNYNRWSSQLTENRNLVSRPGWAAVKGSVDPNKLRAIPGQVVLYNAGFNAPEIFKTPEMPAFAFNHGSMIKQDFDYVARQSDVNSGTAPPGVEAASAIAYLQEENDSVLGPTISSLEEGMEEIGTQTLYLVRQYWNTPRALKITSESEVYETQQFIGSDLSETIDFRVLRSSMAPRSIAGKQALIFEVVKLGGIPPVEALKYLQMAETNKMYSDLQVDTKQASRENHRMKEVKLEEGSESPKLPVNGFDNHVIHMMTHARFMKGQEYEMMQPVQQQIFLAHYTEHQNILGQAQLEEERREDDAGPTGSES